MAQVQLWIQQYGALIVGIAVFLECSAFLGFIIPGEATVVLGGILASHGNIDLTTILIIAFLGGYAGDLVGFWIGHRFGEIVVKNIGKKFGYKDVHFEKVHNFFEKYGPFAVIVGRYLSVFRTLLPITIGTAKYEVHKFALYDAIGTALWVTTFIFIGYFLGESWEHWKAYLLPLSVLTFLIGLGIVYLLFRSKKHAPGKKDRNP